MERQPTTLVAKLGHVAASRRREIVDLRQVILFLRKEVEVLDRGWQAASLEMGRLEAALDEAKGELLKAQNELAHQKEVSDQLASDVEDLEAAVKNKNHTIVKLEAEAEQWAEHARKQAGDIDRLREENAALKEQLHKAAPEAKPAPGGNGRPQRAQVHPHPAEIRDADWTADGSPVL